MKKYFLLLILTVFSTNSEPIDDIRFKASIVVKGLNPLIKDYNHSFKDDNHFELLLLSSIHYTLYKGCVIAGSFFAQKKIPIIPSVLTTIGTYKKHTSLLKLFSALLSYNTNNNKTLKTSIPLVTSCALVSSSLSYIIGPMEHMSAIKKSIVVASKELVSFFICYHITHF